MTVAAGLTVGQAIAGRLHELYLAFVVDDPSSNVSTSLAVCAVSNIVYAMTSRFAIILTNRYPCRIALGMIISGQAGSTWHIPFVCVILPNFTSANPFFFSGCRK